MTLDRNAAVARALIKLDHLFGILPDDRAALIDSFGDARHYSKSSEIIRQGEPIGFVSILLDGFACALKMLRDGAQQNLAIFIPGDLIGWTELLAGKARTSVCAITPVRTMVIPRASAVDLIQRHPAIERAAMRNMILDNAVSQEWMVGFGRRSASQRLAHVLCEIFVRLQNVGLASDNRCDFPLTQDLLADTLGLSVVHTNRMLQQLRGEGLIVLERGRLSILDWRGLSKAGAFDPDYLSLPRYALA